MMLIVGVNDDLDDLMIMMGPQDKWGTLLGDVVINVGNSKWVEEWGSNSSDEISENYDDILMMIVMTMMVRVCWW